MTKFELIEFLNKLTEFFDKKDMPEAKVKQIYKLTRKIPGGEVLDWIGDDIMSSRQYLPINPAFAILEGWKKYQAENPQRMTNAQEYTPSKNCDVCGGSGYLTVCGVVEEGPFKGRPSEAICRCGHCHQATEHGIPFATREQIEAMGKSIKPPPPPAPMPFSAFKEGLRCQFVAECFERGGDFYDMVNADKRAAEIADSMRGGGDAA